MKSIDTATIDMIFTDLPYGTTACKWDSLIPLEPLWEQYKRIIKPKGAIVLFSMQPFTSALIMSNPKMYRCEWIWKKQKPTNFYHAKHMPLREHENILVFGKSATVYYPQGTKEVNIKSGRKNKSSNIYYSYNGGDYIQKVGNYPRTIIEIPTEGDANRFHTSQKPTALCEYFIQTYTQENEVVLDSCCGSGSILVAAKNLGRNYIGLDNGVCDYRKSEYFNMPWSHIAQERLRNAEAYTC